MYTLIFIHYYKWLCFDFCCYLVHACYPGKVYVAEVQHIHSIHIRSMIGIAPQRTIPKKMGIQIVNQYYFLTRLWQS